MCRSTLAHSRDQRELLRMNDSARPVPRMERGRPRRKREDVEVLQPDAEHALRGLVDEDDVAVRVDEDHGHGERGRELAEEDELDRLLGHGTEDVTPADGVMDSPLRIRHHPRAMSGVIRSGARRAALVAASVLCLATGLAPIAAAAPAPQVPIATTAAAAPSDARIKLSLRTAGLSDPVFVTSARDGTDRMFIVEQTGRIRIYVNGAVRSTPFLSIGTSISNGSEQGLLGLAFHPSFKTNHKLYINYTNTAGDTVIREYRTSSSNPNVVDKSTGRTILKIDQPYANHNGGMLAFGRDGYLYIGMGDGGDGGDPQDRAQNVNSLLGKLLRIDVNHSTSTTAYRSPSTNPYVGTAGRDEIWEIGLRNPWRFSFDRSNGNLWIGDVGQDAWEEVDRAIATSSGAGRKVNWGWDDMEGRHCYEPMAGCRTSGRTLPLAEYGHANGRCAVTGGYVFRGARVPALVGGYVFADYCSGEIWVVSSGASSPATKTLLLDTSYQISGFGESAGGELYVLDHAGGAMYLVVQG
jgi:glucose/arabinose dehydrogenase